MIISSIIIMNLLPAIYKIKNQIQMPLSIERGRGRREEPLPFLKRILIVDDDPDITLAFKIGLEDKSFDVYAYTDPLEALFAFKPHFYDLLLVDINMPKMNGFELCNRILKIDINVRICFITAGDTNIEALERSILH